MVWVEKVGWKNESDPSKQHKVLGRSFVPNQVTSFPVTFQPKKPKWLRPEVWGCPLESDPELTLEQLTDW